MLILLGIVVALIFIAILGYRLAERYSDWRDGGGFTVCLVSVILAILIVIVVVVGYPVSYLGWQGFKEKYDATDRTVAEYKAKDGEIGDAGLIIKVVEINQELASWQFQNRLFIIGEFVPDDVDEYEPLQMN